MAPNIDNGHPIPENEIDRILELSDLDLDYTDLKKYLNDLSKLAAKVAGTSISFVNLIDSFTQWTVSYAGFELDQMSREDSVCQYTIASEEEFEIKDLTNDERFNDKFYVKGDPNLVYYFGVPLTTKSGQNIGALCVLDKKSKELDPEKKELLKLIADEVVNRLDFLKQNQELRDELTDLKETHRKVSHDIRGPIGGIIGLSQILESDAKNNIKSEDYLELISLIRKGGESVLELANDIMNRDGCNQKPSEGEFNCESFCLKLKELYVPQAKSKNVNLIIQNTQEVDSVLFSKAKLLQIAGNLISNSIKFTPQKGIVKVEVDIIESAEGQSNLLVIKVTDDGIGMSQETIDKILSDTTSSLDGTAGEKGYGFGLSLVKHLVMKAHGFINVDSKEEKGTTFVVTLPV